MKQNRLASLLLAILLVLGVCPARAAGSPTLETTTSSDVVTLDLKGLEGEYCGIQATVTLDSQTSASFEPDEELYNIHPSLYYTYIQNGQDVTVYIIAKSPLNSDSSLRLGVLKTEEECSAAPASGLKLLTLDDLEGTFFENGALPGAPSGSQTPSQTPTPSNPGNSTNTTTPVKPSPTPSNPTSYRVTAPEGLSNGAVQVSPLRAEPGETVNISVIPDIGYVWDFLTVTAENGKTVALTDLGNGNFRFSMPSSAVTIEAAFVPVPAEPNRPVPLPFLDVATTAWYFEAASYVYDRGLMRGVNDYTFEPNGNTTRAQIVTILHRMEGEPAPLSSGGFVDAVAGQWYTVAIDWAAGEKIVEGYGNDRFGPDDNITREQMAAILYRYARQKGYDTTASGGLDAFTDRSSVSSWAEEAMGWAVGCGLLTGKGGGILDPQGTATRAEVATILMRFCGDFAG